MKESIRQILIFFLLMSLIEIVIIVHLSINKLKGNKPRIIANPNKVDLSVRKR